MGHLMSTIGNPGGPHLDEKALEKVTELIVDIQPESMVTGFVLIVQTADAEDRWLSTFTAPGQKAWESLGMLGYCTAIENNAALVDIDDEDDR